MCCGPGNILLDEASVAELDARRAGNLHTPANVKGATFIDYEYGGYNARAFDVANHFCGMVMLYVCPPSCVLTNVLCVAYI